jgi:hypothetical protein
MTKKILTLEKVAGRMVWKGVALSVQAVRWRVKKAIRAGHNMKFKKVLSPRRRLVDGLSESQVDTLCLLWKNTHV